MIDNVPWWTKEVCHLICAALCDGLFMTTITRFSQTRWNLHAASKCLRCPARFTFSEWCSWNALRNPFQQQCLHCRGRHQYFNQAYCTDLERKYLVLNKRGWRSRSETVCYPHLRFLGTLSRLITSSATHSITNQSITVRLLMYIVLTPKLDPKRTK